ncbi:unnamed protein product [Dracunculus medinensis]|uniref:PMI_typeI_cat domain-containing protein n=1 Tax=Dracunculus medinensis TaxID=318479 RepID=A0A0N4UKZ5_DRAME|nr:unnamed protein product [Dracunculus medinensis]
MIAYQLSLITSNSLREINTLSLKLTTRDIIIDSALPIDHSYKRDKELFVENYNKFQHFSVYFSVYRNECEEKLAVIYCFSVDKVENKLNHNYDLLNLTEKVWKIKYKAFRPRLFEDIARVPKFFSTRPERIMKIQKLHCAVQCYDWGCVGESSLVANLKKSADSNFIIEKKPYAECLPCIFR